MIQHTGAAFCRPLRVLLVADSLDVGGAEQHVVSLAVALAQKGYHVTLACSVEGSLASFPRQGNVLVQPLLHTLVKRQFSLGFAWQLSQLVRRGSFDLVHAHMYTSAFASACALFGTSIPLVITEHSQANWRSKHAQRCSRWFYHRASHIIAVSKEIRRRLIERDNVPFDRVSVIMNATPLLAVPNTEPVLPVEIGKGLLVGMVARLQPEKGPTYFLEAAAYVLRVVQDIQFLVVGDGPMRAKLQAYAVQLGIQKHVHFLGFRLDARSLIGLLDILVVPSLSEGTPLVTLEAMTADVAVVATK
ncbi:MAG: glycosyltransferase, partial [Ktedonobacteraceae bacterium]|nr:glycosyltransferase [Ktedonobacteraceae bacterium]